MRALKLSTCQVVGWISETKNQHTHIHTVWPNDIEKGAVAEVVSRLLPLRCALCRIKTNTSALRLQSLSSSPPLLSLDDLPVAFAALPLLSSIGTTLSLHYHVNSAQPLGQPVCNRFIPMLPAPPRRQVQEPPIMSLPDLPLARHDVGGRSRYH